MVSIFRGICFAEKALSKKNVKNILLFYLVISDLVAIFAVFFAPIYRAFCCNLLIYSNMYVCGCENIGRKNNNKTTNLKN